MKVAILGCGNLGGVMAGRLADQADLELTVIDRDERIGEAVSSAGLTLRQGGKSWTLSLRLLREADGGPFDALILATKAASLLDAAAALRPRLSPEACVVTVQNGLAALDLVGVVGADRLVPGCVLWGASMDGPGVYRITNSGPFIIGAPSEAKNDSSVSRAEDILSRIFPVRVRGNMRGILWSKLAITSTFTTLGAIAGLPFGRLAADGEIRRIMLRIGAELVEVARSEGVAFQALNPALDTERLFSNRGHPRFLKHLLLRVLGYKIRDDESSMLDSIRRSQKTEIDFINGRLVRSADQRGVPVPYNRLAVELIRRMEAGELEPGRQNLAGFRSPG